MLIIGIMVTNPLYYIYVFYLEGLLLSLQPNRIELNPNGTEQLKARIKNEPNSRKILMPSPKASINKMIAVPIAPKTTYSDISITFLYLVLRFRIMVSIMIEEGIPNTITIGDIYINPNTKLPIKLLKVICSY